MFPSPQLPNPRPTRNRYPRIKLQDSLPTNFLAEAPHCCDCLGIPVRTQTRHRRHTISLSPRTHLNSLTKGRDSKPPLMLSWTLSCSEVASKGHHQLSNSAPTCISVTFSPRFLIVVCTKLSIKPWPVTVAGLPLYLTADHDAPPINLGENSRGPKISIDTTLLRWQTPDLQAFK